MCIDINWDTTIKVLGNILIPLAATFIGAKLAFGYDRKLEQERETEKQLQWIYAYFGHLLSLFNGYDMSADSFIQAGVGTGYRIDNNMAKVQNDANYNWGSLGFLTVNSPKLYELTFLLERHVDITVEKYNIYGYKLKNGGGITVNNYIIAKRQFVETYAGLLALIESYNSYAKAHYNKALMSDDLKIKLDEAREKVKQIVLDIDNTGECTLGDGADFHKRMDDKANWYLTFDNERGANE